MSDVTIRFVGQDAGVASSAKQAADELTRLGGAARTAADGASEISKLAAALKVSEAEARKFADGLGLSDAQITKLNGRIAQLGGAALDANGKLRTLQGQFIQVRDAVGQTDQAFQKAAGSTDKIGKSLRALELAQVGGQLQQLGQQVNGLSGAALTASTGLNSAQAKLGTIAGDTDAFTAAARELSDELGNQVSTTELVNSAYDVYSSGAANASDAVEVLSASTQGAIGGFSDVNTVADATTSVLNAYGLSFDQAGSIVDRFIQVQNAGKIVVDEYAQQIGKVAPLAAQAGISLDELNGFVATATIKGVGAEPAFTGLRQAIAAILKPTADTQKVLESIGITSGEAALKQEGLVGILRRLNEAGLDNAGTLTKLFGSVDAVTAIAPSAGAGFKLLETNIAGSANSAGAAQAAFEKVSASFDGQTKAALNQLNEALVSLGNGVRSAVTPILAALATLLQGFNALPEPVKEFVGVVVALTGGAVTLAGALALTAAVLPAISGGFATMGALAVAASGGFATMSATAVTGSLALTTFQAAIAATTTAIGGLASMAVAALPPLALLTGAVLAVGGLKAAQDMKNFSEALASVDQGAKVAGDAAITLASQTKALNDEIVRGGGKATEDQRKQAEQRIALNRQQVAALQQQLAQAKALQPANEDQKAAQDGLTQSIQASIRALQGQTTALQATIGAKKGDATATADQTEALKKQADALKDARESGKRKLEESAQDTKAAKEQADQDARQAREQDFQDARQDREQSFQDAKQAREDAFRDEQARKEQAFQDAKQAREDAFRTQQQAREQQFQDGKQRREQEFQDSQQRNKEAFDDRQRATAEAFNKRQQQDQAEFAKAQQQARRDFDRALSAEQRQIERGLDLAQAKTPEERQRLTQGFRQQDQRDAALAPLEAKRQQFEEQQKKEAEAQKAKQDAEAAKQRLAERKEQQDFEASQKLAERKFKEEERQKEIAFKATQADAERKFKVSERELERQFKEQQKADERQFKASEREIERSFKAQEREAERQFKLSERNLDRAQKAQQISEERQFKEQMRAYDRETANQVKSILQSVKIPTPEKADAKLPATAPKPTPRRLGGDLAAGELYQVGEAGPELAVFARDGYMLNHQEALALAREALGSRAPVSTVAIGSAPAASNDPLLAELRSLRQTIERREASANFKTVYEGPGADFERQARHTRTILRAML